MARRVKPKIKYKNNKKAPKALPGALIAQVVLGGIKDLSVRAQRRRAKDAEDKFDQSRLQRGVSKATQEMAEQPIDQSYIESLQQQQASDRASAMGALSKDPRNVLAGVQALEAGARRERTGLLGMQQQAKTRAMENLAREQQRVEDQRLSMAEGELAGIRAEKAAGQQNIFGGLEDIASGIAEFKSGSSDNNFKNPTGEDIDKQKKDNRTTSGSRELPAEKGGKIDEDGGVTPGKFDHDSNPIDMVKDGKKIGEATGGELILPPDDVKDIRMALDKGDKDSAFKLMEKLVAKYDSNVIGGDDDSEAQEGASMPTDPPIPGIDGNRANEIAKVMKENSDQVRNLGELPFDKDPTNPAGLVKYVGDKLSFDIDSTSVAEIDFIRKYRDFLIKEKGRVDAPQTKMMDGGYLAKVKARMGSYIKSKM